jgi:TonB family protein
MKATVTFLGVLIIGILIFIWVKAVVNDSKKTVVVTRILNKTPDIYKSSNPRNRTVIRDRFDLEEAPPLSPNDTLQIAPVMPKFPGGMKALMQYLAENTKWPNTETDVFGRVIVQFVVDKEGNIVNPKVVRGIHPLFDKEALRVVNQMPKWEPGELEDGTKVAVWNVVPILFKLQ